MYISPNRFESGSRTSDLEDVPVSGVDHVGAGMVVLVSYHPDHGVTYEQTEPIGDNWHRYGARHTEHSPVRPS